MDSTVFGVGVICVPDSYPTIQAAVNAATPTNNSILVFPGMQYALPLIELSFISGNLKMEKRKYKKRYNTFSSIQRRKVYEQKIGIHYTFSNSLNGHVVFSVQWNIKRAR
jgi:hypothetical protein